MALSEKACRRQGRGGRGMTELLQNAADGWAGYKGDGKLAALLLAALLFLWFTGRAREQRVFLLYTSAAAACCILPVAAVLLMRYQTWFYSYVWIWSLVPLTVATAYGLTLFFAWLWGDSGGSRRRALPVTALLAAAVLFSGDLGRGAEERAKERAEREEARLGLGMLSEQYPGEELCLWAPQRIMEYAREADGRYRLPYGRDLWDASLSFYAYGGYGEREAGLHLWMEWVDGALAGPPEAELNAVLAERAAVALELGVDCVLLSARVPAETAERMAATLGAEAQRLGDFLVFRVH